MNKSLVKCSNQTFHQQKGISLVELLIVIVVAMVLTAAAIMSLSSPKKYSADDQTFKILDFVQEARQRAINQKSVMRLEFNSTTNQINLIDENTSTVTTDDLIIKSLKVDTANVTVGIHPSNVSLTTVPQPSTTFGEIAFANTTYPMSLNQNVFTLCFVKDGRVVQTGANGLCSSTNSLRGATVYIYSLPKANGKSEIVRALTISGTTGASAIYKCNQDATGTCTSWIN